MLRQDIEKLMIKQGIKQIDLIYKQTDTLAKYCELKGNILYDYTNHRVKRTIDIWGYLKWSNGTSVKQAFEEGVQQ